MERANFFFLLFIATILVFIHGCARPAYVSVVKVEQPQTNHQEDSFIALVYYMRKHNKDVVTPEMEMTAATYIKNAGMDWSCNKRVKKCYLVYKDVQVTISPEFVEIEMDNGNRVYKIYNVENAARIIYSR